MKNACFSALLVFCLTACGSDSKPAPNAADATAARSMVAAPDSLVIDVDSTGHIQIGSHVCTFDNLTQVLTDSLQSIKTATGLLPDTIVLHKKGEVLMGTRGEIYTSIQEAKAAVH